MTTDEMSEIITNASARIDYLIGRVNALSKERDALLALLRETALYMGEPTRGTPARNELIRTIRAAIAKAEGREP